MSMIFATSYLGIHISTASRRIANANVNVAMLSIGNQAQAYCNEARYKNETNNGKCSGTDSFPESRCTSSASGSACVIE